MSLDEFKCVTIGDCRLYLGDALKIIPMLEKVHMVATDPPYKITSGGNSTGAMSGKFSHKRYSNDGNLVTSDIDWPDFMGLIYDVLKDGHAYFMCNDKHIRNALNAASDAGFRFHNMLVWNKGTATANRWYMKNGEFICFFFKGHAKMINKPGSRQIFRVDNVVYRNVIETDNIHPTEKPVEVFVLMINNSSLPGEMVLDPFMGVGTSAVAAVRTGRKFIGIEIEEKWFDQACERVAEAYDRKQYNLV